MLRGHHLWAVQNSLGQITEVRLDHRFRSGAVVGTTTDPSFRFPTTADIAHGRMLVVNSQFNRRTAGHAARAALHALEHPGSVSPSSRSQ